MLYHINFFRKLWFENETTNSSMNGKMNINRTENLTLRNREAYILRGQLLVVLLLLLVVLFSPVALIAQGTVQVSKLHLTLEEALEMARDNNIHIRMADEDVNIVRSQYRETNALFLPQVTFEETAISTNNPLNVFGSKLRQEVVTAADFDPTLLNNPGDYENYTTSISVRQPLINPSGFLGRGAIKNQLESTRLQKVRTQEYIDFQVKQTWYQLILVQRRVGIIDTAMTAAKSNFEQARDFFDQGMINRADLLAAEVRIKQLRNDRTEIRNMRETTQRRLAYLLGVEEDINITPAGTLKMKQVPDVDVNFTALNRTRSDMMALDNQIEASKKKLTSMKFNFVPSVNLFGSYEWNDDTLFGTEASNYLVGATLKWDLFKGFENVASIQRSRAELSKAKLQYQDNVLQNRVEISSALRSMETAREQVDIAEATVEQAGESYRIRRNRYEQGMERMSDLLMAEASLAQSKLQLASALFDYNVQTAKLEYLLEQDLTN